MDRLRHSSSHWCHFSYVHCHLFNCHLVSLKKMFPLKWNEIIRSEMQWNYGIRRKAWEQLDDALCLKWGEQELIMGGKAAILWFLAMQQSNALLDLRKYKSFCYVLLLVYIQKDYPYPAKQHNWKQEILPYFLE